LGNREWVYVFKEEIRETFQFFQFPFISNEGKGGRERDGGGRVYSAIFTYFIKLYNMVLIYYLSYVYQFQILYSVSFKKIA
jgi:hypothetical protein